MKFLTAARIGSRRSVMPRFIFVPLTGEHARPSIVGAHPTIWKYCQGGGAVCLALAAYGLGVLPVNWFGLIFLAIAFVLFVLDIKAPTHGALTVAGVASLIVGSLVLFNSPGTPSFQRVSVPLVIGVSVATAAVFFTILMIALRAQRAPIRTGLESLVGRTVHIGGELWTSELAEGEDPIPEGTEVEVIDAHGVRIIVRKTE